MRELGAVPVVVGDGAHLALQELPDLAHDVRARVGEAVLEAVEVARQASVVGRGRCSVTSRMHPFWGSALITSECASCSEMFRHAPTVEDRFPTWSRTARAGTDGDRPGPGRHRGRAVLAVGAAGGRRPRRTRCAPSGRPARPSSPASGSTWAGSPPDSGSTGRRCSAGSATATRCCRRCSGRWPCRPSCQADAATPSRRAPTGWSAILTHFADDLITADYFRGFLRREPARALRLLTTKESEIQRRYVAVVEHAGPAPSWASGRSARDRPGGPRLPAGPRLGVVHLRRPDHRRPPERRARAGPPSPWCCVPRSPMSDYAPPCRLRHPLERQRPVRPPEQHRLLRGHGHHDQRAG